MRVLHLSRRRLLPMLLFALAALAAALFFALHTAPTASPFPMAPDAPPTWKSWAGR